MIGRTSLLLLIANNKHQKIKSEVFCLTSIFELLVLKIVN